STYDANHRMTSRTWTGPGVDPVHVSFSYNARGGLTGLQRYNDSAGSQLVSQATFVYDPVGQMTQLTHADGSGNTLVDYHYTYDAAGQLTQETHHGQTDTYQYDGLGQLTGVTHTGQANENYSYDANGNRTNPGYVTGANNQVLADGTFTYAYDAEGN